MKKFLILAVLLLCGAVLAYKYYPRRQPKHVILITIDTLRADRMGLYGHKRNTSPELDRRAKNAIVFDRALVQWPKTVPSMVSMFSSTYPHTNGVMFASRGQYVDDRLVMMPELLQQNGYSTYGIVSNAVLADATNFSQGFDEYVETWLDESRGLEHSRADHVTDLALSALDELKGKEKFFLWLHYVDPHYSYQPPAPYDRMFVGDKFYNKKKVLKKNAEDNNYYDGVAGRIYDIDQSLEWDHYLAQYDAEIKFLDDQLKRLFTRFDELDLWDNSLIVFTADHGESLGENHYYFEHGWFPYTSCSHVPLIVWNPAEKPRRVTASTALIDLAPSVLRRLKLPSDSSYEGKPWDFQTPRPVHVDSGEGGLNRHNYIRSLWIWPYHLVYVPSENYQRMMQKTLVELYNVEQDWAETKNIAATNPEKTKEMERMLLQWIRSAPKYSPATKKTPDYDPEAIEQMEALGYVQ